MQQFRFFWVIVVGYLLKKIGWINEGFIKASNKINLSINPAGFTYTGHVNNDFLQKFDGMYVVYCAVVTSICFFATWVGAKLLVKDKTIVVSLFRLHIEVVRQC